MLLKENRLRKKRDFDLVFKKGKVFKEDFLVLKIAKNNLNKSRFGFIVSQKVSKKAVLRNKIKRKLREIIRLNLKLENKEKKENNNKKKEIDAVLIALPGIDKEDFLKIKENIGKLLKKSGLIVK